MTGVNTHLLNCDQKLITFRHTIITQDLQKQKVIVNPVTASTPPYAVIGCNGNKTEVKFGAELMAKVEVFNGKLAINSISLPTEN